MSNDTQALNAGLPPKGSWGSNQWIGWDDDGNAYLLSWHEPTQVWRGVGFEPLHPKDLLPVAFVTFPGDETSRIKIVRHRAIRP